jgi:hypothetical protein
MYNRALVGRCGLYCGACTIYRAQRDDPDRRKRIAERCSCTVEQVGCNGCGMLTPEDWGYDCKFVVCQRAKEIPYCFECEDFAICEKFQQFCSEYLEDGVDLRTSLAMIQEGRIETFLTTMKKRYTCKNCGGSLSVGETRCHHCQKEL